MRCLEKKSPLYLIISISLLFIHCSPLYKEVASDHIVKKREAKCSPEGLALKMPTVGLFIGVNQYEDKASVDSKPAHAIGAAMFYETFAKSSAERLIIDKNRKVFRNPIGYNSYSASKCQYVACHPSEPLVALAFNTRNEKSAWLTKDLSDGIHEFDYKSLSYTSGSKIILLQFSRSGSHLYIFRSNGTFEIRDISGHGRSYFYKVDKPRSKDAADGLEQDASVKIPVVYERHSPNYRVAGLGQEEKRLFAITAKGELHVFSVGEGHFWKVLALDGIGKNARAGFCDHDQKLVVANKAQLAIWSLEDFAEPTFEDIDKPIFTDDRIGKIQRMEISRSQTSILVQCEKNLWVYDINKLHRPANFHNSENSFYLSAISPMGDEIAIGHKGGVIEIRSVRDKVLKRVLRGATAETPFGYKLPAMYQKERITALQYGDDPDTVFSVLDNRVIVFKGNFQFEPLRVHQNRSLIQSAGFSPSSGMIYAYTSIRFFAASIPDSQSVAEGLAAPLTLVTDLNLPEDTPGREKLIADMESFTGFSAGIKRPPNQKGTALSDINWPSDYLEGQKMIDRRTMLSEIDRSVSEAIHLLQKHQEVLLVLYINAHGRIHDDAKAYVLPADYNFKPQIGGISYMSIVEKVRQFLEVPHRHPIALIILDTCQAIYGDLPKARREVLDLPDNLYLLTSAAPGQFAFHYTGKKASRESNREIAGLRIGWNVPLIKKRSVLNNTSENMISIVPIASRCALNRTIGASKKMKIGYWHSDISIKAWMHELKLEATSLLDTILDHQKFAESPTQDIQLYDEHFLDVAIFEKYLPAYRKRLEAGERIGQADNENEGLESNYHLEYQTTTGEKVNMNCESYVLQSPEYQNGKLSYKLTYQIERSRTKKKDIARFFEFGRKFDLEFDSSEAITIGEKNFFHGFGNTTTVQEFYIRDEALDIIYREGVYKLVRWFGLLHFSEGRIKSIPVWASDIEKKQKAAISLLEEYVVANEAEKTVLQGKYDRNYRRNIEADVYSYLYALPFIRAVRRIENNESRIQWRKEMLDLLKHYKLDFNKVICSMRKVAGKTDVQIVRSFMKSKKDQRINIVHKGEKP